MISHVWWWLMNRDKILSADLNLRFANVRGRRCFNIVPMRISDVPRVFFVNKRPTLVITRSVMVKQRQEK